MLSSSSMLGLRGPGPRGNTGVPVRMMSPGKRVKDLVSCERRCPMGTSMSVVLCC